MNFCLFSYDYEETFLYFKKIVLWGGGGIRLMIVSCFKARREGCNVGT